MRKTVTGLFLAVIPLFLAEACTNSFESFEYYLNESKNIDALIIDIDPDYHDFNEYTTEGGLLSFFPGVEDKFVIKAFGEMGQTERTFYRIGNEYFIRQIMSNYNKPFHMEGSIIAEEIETYYLVSNESVYILSEEGWKESPEDNYYIDRIQEVNALLSLDS